VNQNFFAQNRRTLLKNSQCDVIVIGAHARLQSSADAAAHFRQDQNFYYLTGVGDPGYILVLSAHDSFLVQPESNNYLDVFYGQPNLASVLGAEPYEVGLEKLTSLLAQARNVGYVAEQKTLAKNYDMTLNPSRAKVLAFLKRRAPKEATRIDVGRIIAGMRMVKQPEEIDCIKEAIERTKQAFDRIVFEASQKPYVCEYQIHADMCHALKYVNSDVAYDPIIASGVNGCTLHYDTSQSVVANNAGLLIDFGASHDGYAADVTRTFCVGTPSPLFNDVFAAVARTQASVISWLKPGTTMKELELHCRALLSAELIQLKLASLQNVQKVLSELYPHATSHFLGLDTHDAGLYDEPLQPGVVLTVEPGLYLKNEGIAVRLEDDILITETGAINLSAAIMPIIPEQPPVLQ
jgi:Xaa-Pro aminopeptidase